MATNLKRAISILLAGLGLLAFGRLVWLETLRPLLAAAEYARLAVTAAGGLVLVAGIGVFIYGSLLFLVLSMNLIQDPEFLQRAELARPRYTPVARQAHHENLLALWHAWLPGLRWLGLGVVLIVIGGYLTR